ncbi:hypothetical protein DMC64_19945 [Amycolatopsis sp. WAC 04197]|uniref:hypothetical protein n=1 Tax=Amycolatopsis sp. WAC 04197 TaxID=2203199 RepID=UPI000F775A6B|nr:hypothetical protein [Amycolatopsis sp. WAC 04197]RSN45120.1 hypothetical protein DMC64_19945 [Amycolatopsis sp. WAC 04197]
MSLYWSASSAAVTAVLIWLVVKHFTKRHRIHLIRRQPYWAALAIVARVSQQRKGEETGWPSTDPEFLDTEPTEVIVLPPQPRPYQEPHIRLRADELANNSQPPRL